MLPLRFPEIYRSPEWKALPKLDRAQLLLVAEGVKPGAIIGGDFTNFQKIIEQIELDTHLNTEPLDLEPVYEVASPAVLAQRYHELVSLPEKTPDEEYHRINGRFLGYPACCTEEYITPTKNRETIRKQYGKKHREMSNFDYEAGQLIKTGQPYPEELDYRPPTYTPCRATCPNALAKLKKWQLVLEQADPEAARWLQRFNWQSEPFRRVHQGEIGQEDQAQLQKDKIRFLRKSAGLEE